MESNFRGKQWTRSGNHYSLSGTRVNVYVWNSGSKANYMVEVIGLSINVKNTWTIPGKGEEARIKAIALAHELSEQYPL